MNKIFNVFKDIEITLRRPRVVIVEGEGKECTSEAIFQTLKPYFNIGRDLIIFSSKFKEEKEIKKAKFLIKNSSLPILVATHVGEIPFDRYFFAGEIEKTREIREMAKFLPSFGYFILNFDDETVREIKTITNVNEITFGFQERADFKPVDIKLNHGTNFKVVFKGNVVPFWLEKTFGKEQIYAGLAAIAVGTVLGLNLVEISQGLKNYSSIPGKMKLTEGIKDSWILDNTAAETLSSIIEGIETLGKIEWPRRKIAILGEMPKIGKYAIEAHETLGERVGKKIDLLFTFGTRAKFIAIKAFEMGMDKEKIFHFDKIEDGKLKVQTEIKKGDLIFVGGERKTEISKIIEEIKKIC